MKNRRTGPAPSMRAASYSSCGMLCRPPSAMTMMNGKPSQMLVIVGAMKAQNSLLNQGTGVDADLAPAAG